MKKYIAIFTLISFIFSCAGATKLTYQELPKDKPLAVKINGVTLRVVSFGKTNDWSELEIAVLNETDKEIRFDPSKVYLTNEKGYDLMPLRGNEINERIYRKTGKWITPLTLGAITAAIAAIVLPHSKDRTNLARAALGLAIAGGAAELAKRQSAEEDVRRKEDLLLKVYKIPPKLQLGGTLYYRSTEAMKGVKAFIEVNGEEAFFEIQL
ncbi:MAG: hypothetical protein N2202_00730 [Proteobacteria bacterium]|nr:hypothetical protein [Pseudomonadota bacterium]